MTRKMKKIIYQHTFVSWLQLLHNIYGSPIQWNSIVDDHGLELNMVSTVIQIFARKTHRKIQHSSLSKHRQKSIITIGTVDIDRPLLWPLSHSPSHGRLNLWWLRSPCIPGSNAQICIVRYSRAFWQLACAIYDCRVTWWQVLHRRRPSSNKHSICNLSI